MKLELESERKCAEISFLNLYGFLHNKETICSSHFKGFIYMEPIVACKCPCMLNSLYRFHFVEVFRS